MIIDVRTPEEYATGYIEGAVNIPVGDMEDGNLGVLASMPKDTLLQLYCRSGARSGYALTILQSTGFSDVTNLGSMQEASSKI